MNDDATSKRILAYYNALMRNTGKADETTENRLKYVLGGMSESDASHLDIKLEKADSQYAQLRRLVTYAEALSGKLKPDNGKLADEMDKILKAYDHYDIGGDVREEIGGNTFIFKKGFPISDYRELLAEYGEEEQGETYSVYLDDEGRLVVY